jgi:histidine triad (HIT) family protein
MNSGEISAPRIAENEFAFAIRDINPRAPVHVLVIPKQHIADARTIEAGHGNALAGMMRLAQEAARLEGVFERGYRLAFNVGEDAGMTVPHLHMHLLGGRTLGVEG